MGEKFFDIVVVLTVHYPFETGEAFLESEYLYLVQHAKLVIFLPLGVKRYDNNRIDEQENVITILGLRERIWKRMGTDLLGLFRGTFWKEYRNFRCEHKNSSTVIKILDYDAQFYRLLHLIKKLLPQYINNSNGNIVFYSYWLGLLSALAGTLKKDYPNAIAISRAHGGDIYGEEQGLEYTPFRRESVLSLDAIFSVSDMGVAYLKNEFKFWKGEIVCSRLGTKDRGLNYVEPAASFTIVSCSELISLKRVHLIIEALALCGGNIRWIHFGDGPLRDSLERKGNTVLSNNIVWSFRGRVSNQTLLNEYKKLSINLFINVSSSEGIPVSIMEALSFGIPVMATDVGGTKEAVFDGYNGKLLPADISADNLAQAIMSFRDELEIHGDQYRKNARDSWEKNYNAEKNYTHFYESLCALYEKNTGCSL